MGSLNTEILQGSYNIPAHMQSVRQVGVLNQDQAVRTGSLTPCTTDTDSPCKPGSPVAFPEGDTVLRFVGFSMGSVSSLFPSSSEPFWVAIAKWRYLFHCLHHPERLQRRRRRRRYCFRGMLKGLQNVTLCPLLGTPHCPRAIITII